MGENITITIPVEEYKKLVETSVRVDIFIDFVQGEKYSISREECGRYFGFEVKPNDD